MRCRSLKVILVVLLCLCLRCGEDAIGPQPRVIEFDSVSPAQGPPGTIITIAGVKIPSPAESLFVTLGDVRIPGFTRNSDNVMIACPDMASGEYNMHLEHYKAERTFAASFMVTEPSPTGAAPGEVTRGVSESLIMISDAVSVAAETMRNNGDITEAEYDSLDATLTAIEDIIRTAANIVAELPDSEKTHLDQQLDAAGLADLLCPEGYCKSPGLDAAALRGFLESQEGYSTFYGLMIGDNISFALSAIKAALTLVNIASALGSLGISAPANVALTTMAFAVGALDNVIEGYIPTDLYEVQMEIKPPDGTTLRVNDTAEIEYLGKFKTQSGPITGTIAIFAEGTLGFLPAGEVTKLLLKIGEMIGVEYLEERLRNQQVVTLRGQIPVDISYYSKTSNEVLEFTTEQLSGILPGIQLLNVLNYAGVSFPALGGEPVSIASSLVTISGDRLSLTADGEGTVSPSEIHIRAWVMDPLCEGEDSWWWTWVCLGIETPENLAGDAYVKPTITILPAVEDMIPPARVTDLATGSVTSSSVQLTWTAPGDDGDVGTASEYDIRYATFEINEVNWNDCDTCTGEPDPRTAGSSETFAVTGLSPDTGYYFALKTADEVPNWSQLSIVASIRTDDRLRTWRIKPDGSGDAPSIQAGIDSAAAGDTVLVESGVYYEAGITVKNGVKLLSESGPSNTAIHDLSSPCPNSENVPTVTFDGVDGTTELKGFLIRGCCFPVAILCDNGASPKIDNCIVSADWGNGIHCFHQSSPVIANSLIHNCGGGGIWCTWQSRPLIEHNTIYHNGYRSEGAPEYYGGIRLDARSTPTLRKNIIAENHGYGIAPDYQYPSVSYCDVWGNEHGNYYLMPDQTGRNGNISADPNFCDPASNDYSLHSYSPCVLDDVDYIGAYSVGCD